MVEAQRWEAIRSTLARVREAAPSDPQEQEPSDTQLQAVGAALVGLASQTALWPLEEFETQLAAEAQLGCSAPSELWTQLAVDPDGRYALYLWLTHQRLTSVPHDHKSRVITGSSFSAPESRLVDSLRLPSWVDPSPPV
jgi:hypothetical protein